MSIFLQEIRSFDRRSLRRSSTDEKMGIVVVEELTDDVIENSEQVATDHENETSEKVESDKIDKNSLKRSSDEDFEDSGRKRQKSEIFEKSSEMLKTQVKYFRAS